MDHTTPATTLTFLGTGAAVPEPGNPVPALSLRITDARTGADFGLSGDTAFEPALAAFFSGTSLLVHESSHGPRTVSPDQNPYLHSSAADAARIAQMAGVRRLYLVHGSPVDAAGSLEVARAIFPDTDLVPVGQSVTVASSGGGPR